MKRTSENSVAKSVSLLAFIFMSFVALLILFKEEKLNFIDYLLILGAPFLLSALFYYVVLHHDPDSSE